MWRQQPRFGHRTQEESTGKNEEESASERKDGNQVVRSPLRESRRLVHRRWLLGRPGAIIRREESNSMRYRFQHVDPPRQRLDDRLQILDGKLKTGDAIAHDVTPLFTGSNLELIRVPQAAFLLRLLLLPDHNSMQRSNS